MKMIPIAKSYFDKRELDLAEQVIRSGWIAQGTMVERFEGELAAYLGARHAVAVSSGTSALHIALIIAGIGQRDAVIVPSFSFIATANAVAHCGAKPVFVDIEPDTYNIDPHAIERYLKLQCRRGTKKRLIDKASGRTVKAIMPVHQFGLPCDLAAVRAIAKRYGLPVIEDAACALGSEYKHRKIGSDSALACFSFHPRKIITTGEGGLIVTDNRAYADAARVVRNHGSGLTAMAKHAGRKSPHAEDYAVLGYNYRLTDLQAAIGIGQLSRLSRILVERKAAAKRYDQAFDGMDSIRTPLIPSYATPNYQSYVIRIAEATARSRDTVVAALSSCGISTRRGNTAIHLQSLYKNVRRAAALPYTEDAARSTIALPVYFGMTGSEQDLVIRKVCSIINGTSH